MGDLLITVAPTGAETAKDDCPQLPTTLEELVDMMVQYDLTNDSYGAPDR